MAVGDKCMCCSSADRHRVGMWVIWEHHNQGSSGRGSHTKDQCVTVQRNGCAIAMTEPQPETSMGCIAVCDQHLLWPT
jgi:hypothetical protein